MKKRFLLLLFIPIAFFLPTRAATIYTGMASVQKNRQPVFLLSDTAFIKQLIVLRNALVQGDKNSVKAFIRFPFIGEGNKLWQLLYDGNEKKLEQLPDSTRPFTEKDFDTCFNNLFTKRFITALSHLNLSVLKKKGEAESPSFRQNPSTTYKMYASVDTTNKTLHLNLGIRTIVKDKKGRVEDNEEYGWQYIFDILPEGKLRFKEISFSA